MRRLLVVLAVVVALAAGAVVAVVVVQRLHGERDIRGSSTEEFVLPTTPAPTPPPLGIEWPQYGFDPTRTRAVSLALRPPFRKVWRYRAGSLVEFPPAVAYGRIYLSTNSGKVAAVNVKTGKRAWKYFSHRCVAASPAVGPQRQGTVFAVFLNRPPCNSKRKHGTGKLIAFAAGFGKIQWQKTIGRSESSPLIVGRRLYVGDWDGRVWAIDAGSGRTLWVRRPTHAAIKGALAYTGGRLYVGAYDGAVYCLGARRGRLVWRAKAQRRLFGDAQFYSTPALAYGRVYIGGTDGKVYSFGATTGKRIWSHSTGGYVYASPAVWNGLVFIGSYSKRFYAFDAATGDVRWTFKANGQISGSPTVVGDVVYFATLKRRTYALAARTGKQLWTFPDGKYSPVVAVRGKLFLVGYARVYGMVPR
jgi:outer membrane protein assembly factor BamB